MAQVVSQVKLNLDQMGEQEKKRLPPWYKQGRLRPFFSTQSNPSVLVETAFGHVDRFYLFFITGTALLTRFYKLPEPAQVVFDETHFGGFAKEYYEGEFFVDVHPPLVKIIYYWIAVLCGWNGDFEFDRIGDIYDISVPYVAMRSFSAFSGALTVVLTYCILRASTCRPAVALFGSTLLLLENSLATQSRFIMLDGPLIAFTALSVLAFKRFELAEPFTKKWYRYLVATGVALGCAISTKLTGLFTLAWVGLWSLHQLWGYVGDLDVSSKKLFAHVAARAVAFIFVPLTVYCGIFSLHFTLLPRNGSGSGAVLPLFKAEFIDSGNLVNAAVDVSYGSSVTIKHHRLEEYLHSHNYNYRTGSQEQQVTMYGFEGDSNNDWVIEPRGTISEEQMNVKFRPIKDGDVVKLYHKRTRKYLRANDVRPPNSEHDYSNEVSCSGSRAETQDVNYEWKVVIKGKKPHSKNDLPLRKLRATETVFQLVHKGTRCTLMGHSTKLPKWAFHQSQVLCVNDPTLPNTLFYIENNHHPVIDKDVATYPRVDLPRLLLWGKLLNYHQAMWRLNQGFSQKHEYSSQPIVWPFVLRGISFFTSGHVNQKLSDEAGSSIYLLGNVAVYFGGIAVVVLFGFWSAFYLLSHMNPFIIVNEPAFVTNYFLTTFQFVSGWFLNYIPYWQMTRQMFAHHYLVSVFFLVLATAQYTEYQVRVRPVLGWFIIAGMGLSAFVCFINTFPLIYGVGWTVEQCERSKYFPTWDYDCMAYSQ